MAPDKSSMPAAICCCSGLKQGFRPFLMISTDNITVGMTMIENLPARQVRNPYETKKSGDSDSLGTKVPRNRSVERKKNIL